LPIRSVEELSARIAICDACDLARHRIRVVPGVGPIGATVFIVGEAPNGLAETRGYPFLGISGDVLDAWLSHLGLHRGQVYLTNAVKCRLRDSKGQPVSQYGPAGQQHRCRRWLDIELKLIQPRVVVSLGWAAISALMPKCGSVSSFRKDGYYRKIGGLSYFALYHPSASARTYGTGAFSVDTRRDLDELRKLLDQVGRSENGGVGP
jgi:uracil-DNA glycosylase family 4